MRSLLLGLLLSACATAHSMHAGVRERSPDWRALDASALEDAEARDALVLLSLQASWCHFCHVMNDETFADPEVLALLGARFVTVREEADRRPDLVARWGLYGWPATIVLDAEGNELVALRGFRPPAELLSILQTVLDDRAAGRRPGASLPEGLRGRSTTSAPFAGELAELLDVVHAQVDATYDVAQDGWGTPQKYPFGALVEDALFRGTRGEAAWRERGLRSLARHVSLIDPVWGGIYQYSVDGVWDHPHYEKLATLQAQTLSSLAAAIELDEDDHAWRAAGRDVLRYLGDRLRAPSGAFFVSQDADVRGAGLSGAAFYGRGDAERRAIGEEPTIDDHVEADVNGLVIAGLARWGLATSDEAALAWARTAADVVWASHCDASGGCAHAEGARRRHLADQAAMLAGLTELYQATGEMRHLERARALAAFLRQLVDDAGGLRASVPDGEVSLDGGVRPFLPGATAARALLVLDRLDEDAGHAALARSVILSLGDPDVLRAQGRIVGELLLALELAVHGTVRMTLVGERTDPRTRALLQGITALGEPRRVLEQVAPGASRYGDPGEPAVFLCAGEACSFPVTDPARLRDALDALEGS